ncbi:hypothetical protein EDB83DRAFT_2319414 [Lactarius deliciosus]|nr:hypothetical protein EDB83DRAFT_2322360 [Lactarius deliciosus]KAH9029768.1 hypothetical protein EDB83DRAFT_2319414 [Lactarius deliciosus]
MYRSDQQAIFSGVEWMFSSRYVSHYILELHRHIWIPQAASGVSSSYGALVDLLECLGNFLKRLRTYTGLPLSPSMLEISIKIIVELLSVLALATKQIKQGIFEKLLGKGEIEGVLRRLDHLAQEEGRMTIVQTLEVVNGLVNNVEVVMNDGEASVDGIWKALDCERYKQDEALVI